MRLNRQRSFTAFKMGFLTLVMLSLFGLLPPLQATEETPTIGFGNNQQPQLGQAIQVLISHASYPRLEAFEVEARYLNWLSPETQTLEAPNDNGILSWTPSQAGEVELIARAPALEGAEAVTISKRVSVEGAGGFPWLLLGLGTLAGFILSLIIYRSLQLKKSQKHGQ